MTERAKLWTTAIVLTAVASAGACVDMESDRSAAPHPVYDAESRQLVRLDWDADGDGRIDQRTYFVNGVAARSEMDSNSDDRVDRWEYVNAAAAITAVGSSSAHDGIEDTWTTPPAEDGSVRIERAQARDRVIDRREFLRDGVLIRAEEDANRDGSVDTWETWQRGVLVSAAFDSTFSRGSPDRRLIYEAGRFAYLEADLDRDGHFERLASHQPGSGEKTRDRH